MVSVSALMDGVSMNLDKPCIYCWYGKLWMEEFIIDSSQNTINLGFFSSLLLDLKF